jgi:hypothetical protein
MLKKLVLLQKLWSYHKVYKPDALNIKPAIK